MTRKIQELAPLLADNFVDYETEQATFENNEKIVNDNISRLGHFHKYLGRLHDSWVLETNLTADKFSIILNDFTTHVFADALIDKKKIEIDHDKLIFPVQLDFETSNLTYNLVDEFGNIRKIKPTIINDYLDEQIISVDNERAEIGVVVWKRGSGNKRGQHILLLMSTKKADVTENQNVAWTNIFGHKFDAYYDYFKTKLASGQYLSDQTLCGDLVDEFDKLIG
jgi:hypothetical protein